MADSYEIWQSYRSPRRNEVCKISSASVTSFRKYSGSKLTTLGFAAHDPYNTLDYRLDCDKYVEKFTLLRCSLNNDRDLIWTILEGKEFQQSIRRHANEKARALLLHIGLISLKL